MIPKTLGERIKKCMIQSQLTEVKLANSMCIPLKKLRSFIKNEAVPSPDEKWLLADLIAGGNYDWLIHGISSYRLDGNTTKTDKEKQQRSDEP